MVVAFLLLALVGVPLRAQSADPAWKLRDSTAASRVARQARTRFERTWRLALPVTDRTAQPECEATVGRWCYWEDEAAPPVLVERQHVTTARRRLLHVLDSLGRRHPGDAWIAGQRVRYRIDAGDTTGAVQTAARRCGAARWWCAALQGYALHVGGDFAGAEEAFDRALAAMPPAQRCGWENPAVLLDPASRSHVERLPCEARRGVARRIWWLATPLLRRGANDAYTEFLARRTASVLESDAQHGHALRWGRDSEELMLRYGWPTWWTRERATTLGGMPDVQLVGHEPWPSYYFLPAPRLVLDSTALAGAADWDLRATRPTMRYAPRALAHWNSLDAQVARFVRGDTLVVVAVFDASGDSLLRDATSQLVVTGWPQGEARSERIAGSRGAAQARLPRRLLHGGGLVGVEVVDTAHRAVARFRSGLQDISPNRLAVSDLLLHAVGEPPASLREAVAAALPSTSVAQGKVGIYWETYGVAAGGESLDVGLTLERVDTPWLRRAAARLGLATRSMPLRIRWQESRGAESGAAPRSVSVDLTALAGGTYHVTLTVAADDGATASTVRTMVIER